MTENPDKPQTATSMVMMDAGERSREYWKRAIARACADKAMVESGRDEYTCAGIIGAFKAMIQVVEDGRE